jgi:uncharacterized protein YegL
MYATSESPLPRLSGLPRRATHRRRGLTAAPTLAAGIALLALASPALGMGLLLPNDQSMAPLAIESHRVDIRVNDTTAVTHVDQVFRNSSPNQLEATFVFPLPAGATVSDFALYINGVRTQGEVLERTQARQIYDNIVRRVRDPGLVEYVDGRIFQASIFPVPANGTQRVEIEFAQVLERQGDLRRLVYPLRTGQTSATTLRDFTLSARIETDDPVRTVYSPSHQVEVVRESENVAIVGLEQASADLEQDFVLYLSASEDDIGIDLMTYDPDGADGGTDGYFLMVLAPRLQDEGQVQAKDVTFVIDTSGSMAGEKIEQARATLRYCVSQLGAGDRFNIVSFSTASRRLFPGLRAVDEDSLAEATRFIDGLSARGGTAIEDALRTALEQESDPERPHMVIFVTDGLPTVGETRADELLRGVAERNGSDARIFTFGVGFDVDTQLLDRVAADNHAVSDYVRPGEDLELAVGALYDRIAYPVLSGVEVFFDQVEAFEVFPRAIPDLFAGQQVVVAGRYRGERQSAVRLAGNFAGASMSYTFEENFSAPESGETEFISEIRRHGESRELVDEVRNLGVEYGLVTPYTSYLAVDDSEFGGPTERPVPVGGRAQNGPGAPGGEAGGAPVGVERQTGTRRSRDGVGSGGGGRAGADPAPPMATASPMQAAEPEADFNAADDEGFIGLGGLTSGEAAVAQSEAVRELRESSVAATTDGTTRRVGGRTFALNGDGAWTQVDASAGDNAAERPRGGEEIVIRYLSEAYLDFAAQHHELRRALGLGERVTLTLDSGVRVVIAPDRGIETLDDATRERLR